MVEITAEEQNKGKRIKRIEDSLWDLWDNGKCTKIWVIGIPEEEGKKERHWEIFWRNYSWKFPQHGKGNSQSSPRSVVSYRLNPRRNTSRYTLIKLTEIKHKQAVRGKQQVTQKEKPRWLTMDLSAETLQARRGWQVIFKVLKEKKIYNQDYFTQ